MRRRTLFSSFFQRAANAAGSRSNASRRRITSTRVRDVGRRLHFDRQAEPVEQLRAQFALLRVAAADQHEARRMAHAQALALDDVLAGRRNVEQHVDQMVLEQVHLVDVQKAAMRAREQARLERLHAVRERAFEIERADDAVLGRAERQVDHGHGRRLAPERDPRASRARHSAHSAAPACGSQP